MIAARELRYALAGAAPPPERAAAFATRVEARAGAGGLSLRFRALCPGAPVAEKRARKARVFEDDCVEAFIDPGLGRYYCWEMNAAAALLDYRARGRAGAIDFEYGWESDCSLHARTRPGGGFECALFVPWSDFGGEEVARLESWRGSFNRIARDGERSYFACTAPFASALPDFHRPEEFGSLDLMPVETWAR